MYTEQPPFTHAQEINRILREVSVAQLMRYRARMREKKQSNGNQKRQAKKGQ